MATKVKRRSAERKKERSAPTNWVEEKSIHGWGNEALALILYGLTAFLFVSTLTFQSRSLVADGGRALRIINLISHTVGPLGRGLGSTLSRMMGWSALIPPVLLGIFANHCWHLDQSAQKKESGHQLLPYIGAILVLVIISALGFEIGGQTIGGSVGALISEPLITIFGEAGAIILSLAFLFAALSFCTKQTIGTVIGKSFVLLKQVVATVLFIAPIYAVRMVFAIVWIFFRGIGFSLSKIHFGWNRLFSAPVLEEPEEEPLPKPRRRKNVIEVKDGEEEEAEELPAEEPDADRYDLGLNVPKKSPKEKKVVELGTLPVEVEDDATETDDEFSHVVVMRRKSAEFEHYTQEKAKRARKKQKEDEPSNSSSADFSNYIPPAFDILTKGEPSPEGEDDEELLQKSRQIESKLRDFSILGRVTEVHPGPVITLFEFEPAPGVKVGKIAALQDDLAMSLRASSIRIIAPIPKKGTVGIEVPNRHRDMVRLRDVLESKEFVESESNLTVPLGKDTYGDPVHVDIAAMPHLLMAGATGTGKSVSINALLVSLLYRASPADLGLILIDPKILELSIYEGIPHLKVPVVTVPKQAKAVLDWAVKEMERRYRMMQKYGVRNIDGYNRIVSGKAEEAAKNIPADVIELKEVVQTGTIEPDDNSAEKTETVRIAEELKPLPKIVIVIDELADLMLTVGRDIEELITRLAQKARAAGIHLILATQRPSVDVITGLIKANFPARLSFRVTSRIDSRTILDSMGAERLLGKGDMLFMQPGATHLRRVHGAFISDSEVQRVVDAVKKTAAPCYDQKIIDLCEKALREEAEGGTSGEGEGGEDLYDPFYDKAVELVVQKGQASTSMIQRAFRIGYNRAARIIEMMERDGVIGPMDGVKPREVLLQGDTSYSEAE